MIGFDQYHRKARLAPGLLGVAPIAILMVTLGLKRYPAIAVASGVVSGAGGAYLLAILVRHLGRRLEPDLWASWGGRPTTRYLRLREDGSNPVERHVWREALQRSTGISLLTATQEESDPARADQTIEAAVNQILYLGQGDGRNPLLHAENIQYGFERNLYGLRWVGRIVSLVCTLGLVAALLIDDTHRSTSIASVLAGVIVSGAFTIGWVFLPSSKRVALAADRYAKQLLQAVVAESQRAHQINHTNGGLE